MVPTYVIGSAGQMVGVTPVMNSPIEFPLAARRVIDTLQLVVDSLSSQTGAKVILLNTPFHLTDTVTMGASDEAAGDVITRLGKIFGVPMAWQCLYETTDKTYYLNVNSIAAPNPPGVPPITGEVVPRPNVGPADTKFFRKD